MSRLVRKATKEPISSRLIHNIKKQKEIIICQIKLGLVHKLLIMILEFIGQALAIFMLSYTITSLEGPFNIFERLRWLSNSQQQDKRLVNLECFYCTSTQVGLVFTLASLYFMSHALGSFIIFWLGSVGLSWLIYSVFNKLDS